MKKYVPCIPEEAYPGSMSERIDGEYYLVSEVDAIIREAIEFMNAGQYGLAAVTLSSAINPPTEL